MSLNDSLNGKTVQDLINDNAFITALVPKLTTGDGDNGVYTKTAADTAFVKTDASNLKDEANKKAFAEAILTAQDDKKSILVNKLGEALDRVENDDNDKVYGTDLANLKIAKDFLADKYPFAKIDASNLKDEANKKAFAEAILTAQDDKKSILVNKLGEALDRVKNDDNDKVYGTDLANLKIAKDFLADKYPFAKIDASNLTDEANKKAFAEAILPAKDGNKSILVGKLEEFLGEHTKAYSNNTKTAKELLVPSAADLVQDHGFKHDLDRSIKQMAVSSNSDFQKNVREVMSQPSFEIPTSDDAALNWTW